MVEPFDERRALCYASYIRELSPGSNWSRCRSSVPADTVEALGMAKVTMYNTIPEIESLGIIIPTRKIGRSQLYRLNGDSEVVKNLRRVIRVISFKMAENEYNESSFQEAKTTPSEGLEDEEEKAAP